MSVGVLSGDSVIAGSAAVRRSHFSEVIMTVCEFSENEDLNLMATCYADDKTAIIVNSPPSENLSFFKYCNGRGYNSQTAVAGISMMNAAYTCTHNNGHPFLVLSYEAKIKLNKKLMLPSMKYRGFTVFQAVIIDYNLERFSLYPKDTEKITEYKSGEPLPLNLARPDYSNLPSEDEVRRIIKDKRMVII